MSNRRVPKDIDPDARSPGIKFPPELYERYSKLIRYGSRNEVVNLVMAKFLDLVDQHGEIAVGALARDAIKFEIDWEKIKGKGND